MILENKIVLALKYFGHLSKAEISDKLRLIGVTVESRDLDGALKLLVINRLVRPCDGDATRYVAR